MIISTTLDELRKTVRRISLHFSGSPPDSAHLGQVLESHVKGQQWQTLIRDPNPSAVAELRRTSGITDFEDTAVSLEEVYAALMARSKGVEIPTVRRIE